MSYQIRITKTTPNPNIEEEVKRFNENRNRNGYDYNRNPSEFPREEIMKDVLLVELTDKEYLSVKQSVLVNFGTDRELPANEEVK